MASYFVYFVDWVVILATIAFSGSMSLWATPSTRPFSLSDRSIAYPYQRKAKIPTYLLLLLSIFIPIVVFIVICFATLQGWRRRIYAANKAILGLLLSIALAMLLTDSLKNLMGRPRPDMLSRCNPSPDLLSQAQIGWDLVTWDVCLGQPGEGSHRLKDGFRSFPSGHSSMSFAGLTYTTLFLASFAFSMKVPFARTIRPFSFGASKSTSNDPPNSVSQSKFPQMVSFMIVAIPMFVATYIASTRWSDYRHHAFDILFGSTMGILCALIGWGWYGVFSCRHREFFKGDDVEMNMSGAGRGRSSRQGGSRPPKKSSRKNKKKTRRG